MNTPPPLFNSPSNLRPFEKSYVKIESMLKIQGAPKKTGSASRAIKYNELATTTFFFFLLGGPSRKVLLEIQSKKQVIEFGFL